jgi:hypothetical protein
VTVDHAVPEEGVALCEIAETLGRGLKVSVVSIPPEKAAEYFGWFAHFAELDMPAWSEWTRYESASWLDTDRRLNLLFRHARSPKSLVDIQRPFRALVTQ